MRAAVQQAHMHHIKVAAHAESLQAVMEAMRAGVDSIEHGSELDQEALDYMKSHNIVLVPTVNAAAGAAVPVNAPPPPPGTFGALGLQPFKSKQLGPLHLASFALALKSGVSMAGGSDNAYTPGSTGIFAELLACVAHGMPPKQAIVSATINSAALVGLAKLGRLSSAWKGTSWRWMAIQQPTFRLSRKFASWFSEAGSSSTGRSRPRVTRQRGC